MFRPLLGLLGAIALLPVQAKDTGWPAAEATVEAYSNAVMASDCATLTTLSAVIARYPEAQTTVCDAAGDWKQRGLIERLREPSTRMASGDDRLIVVPFVRVMLFEGRPQITNSMYVAYSKNAGRDWLVIDVVCDHLKDWVKGVYPTYDGHIVFESTLDFPLASR